MTGFLPQQYYKFLLDEFEGQALPSFYVTMLFALILLCCVQHEMLSDMENVSSAFFIINQS